MYKPVQIDGKPWITPPEKTVVNQFWRNGELIRFNLNMFLQSRDNHDIFITNEMHSNLFSISRVFQEIQDYIKLVTGYDVVIAHALRTDETTARLQREGKKPSSTSQHPYGEALDIHVYLRGVRIRDTRINRAIAVLILDMMNREPSLKILQIFFYTWGIHFSIRTQRSNAAGIKSKFGYGGR